MTDRVVDARTGAALDLQGELIRGEGIPRPAVEVVKRSGATVPFDAQRILLAVARAGQATGEFTIDRARALASCVVAQLQLSKGRSFSVEDIQDAVELNLMQAGHFKTARSFIRYREQHRQMREQKQTVVDVGASIEEYIDRRDWRVNANANQGYSLGGMILNSSGKMTANYWLNYVYPPEVGAAHREGDFHIHDLDMLSGYCAGWSLRTLLHEGYNGVCNKIEAAPPRHFRTALGQMVNFLGTLQNEWAGAQAFSSVDTYLAPFVRIDKLDYEQIRQSIQEFIFNLNVPSRWGTQTPFTNLTFDWTCPEDLKKQIPIIGGKELDFTYGDLQAEMDQINRAYLEVMMEGDAHGRVFTFPIPTYNITREFDWDHPNCELLFEMTAKYGLPYFQNFINSDLRPQDIRSMCCRLQLDLRELLKRGNGLFGSAEQTGSIGVVTINCARLGYNFAGSEPGLLKQLDHLMELAKTSLELKRKFVQGLIDGGLFPYTKRYLPSLRNHFSTIGVNGVNECVRNFFYGKENIGTTEGRALALRLLRHIRTRMTEFQQVTGHLYNLEASPAEGATYRFAREDKKRYPDILQAGIPDAPYYSNSSQLPVSFSSDPFEVLEHQEEFQQQYTGGTVVHLYMGERISSARNCKMLVKNVLTRFRIPYVTITPTFSVCPKHGYLNGEQKYCPKCDAEVRSRMGIAETDAVPEDNRVLCEVWTRVMGYHRPVDQFNAGKKSEYAERTPFQEPPARQLQPV
jgi:ribonucleoside-triphosphate reductase (formate)